MELHFHHVGVLVKDIGRAAENYLRLGYLARSGMVHDPAQTAYVQFFRLPGDGLYLELVSPDGAGSKLSNALAKGGGLHHVCYAVGDIEGACAELSSAGWFSIAEPTPAVAFGGRRVAWLRGADRLLTELVEKGGEGEL
jgi:methylmalonyl-CoA/ethylmalonyl-CoA epimerase